MTEPQTTQPVTFPVNIQLERWSGPRSDHLEVIDTVTISIKQVVAELDEGVRAYLSQSAADNACDLDWVYERAADLGLIAPHDGPYTVDLEPLHEWMEENPDAIAALPYRTRRMVTTGRPLAAPVTAEPAVTDAGEDGFLTALVQVPFDDFLAAAASRDDSWDEHDLLATKVSPLLPYASEYRVVGLVHDEDGVSQPDLLVLFTNNVAESASTLLDNEGPRG